MLKRKHTLESKLKQIEFGDINHAQIRLRGDKQNSIMQGFNRVYYSRVIIKYAFL